MYNWIGIIVSFVFVGFIIFLSSKLHFSVPENQRKFVHIILGNWWFIPLIFIDSWPYAIFPPFIFIFVNLLAAKTKNTALSSEVSEREYISYGTVLYPISMCVLVILSYCVYKDVRIGGIGMIALAYGDGLAAVIGTKYPYGRFSIFKNKKSLSGCLTMFIVSFLLIYLYLTATNLFPFQTNGIIIVAIISFISTIAEILTPYGFDNLSVPIISVLAFRLLSTLL